MGNKILVADDDEEIRGALSRILADYDLVSAEDGKTALKLAASEKPAVVLLDVAMPGLDGLQVLRKLREMRHAPAVIMITGDSSEETVKKALSTGVFSYIIKPVEKDQVREQVRRAFQFLEESGE